MFSVLLLCPAHYVNVSINFQSAQILCFNGEGAILFLASVSRFSLTCLICWLYRLQTKSNACLFHLNQCLFTKWYNFLPMTYFWLPQLFQDLCASQSGLYLLPWLLLWDRSDFHGLIYEINVTSLVCSSLQNDLLLRWVVNSEFHKFCEGIFHHEFIQLIRHLNNDGMLLNYSNKISTKNTIRNIFSFLFSTFYLFPASVYCWMQIYFDYQSG